MTLVFSLTNFVSLTLKASVANLRVFADLDKKAFPKSSTMEVSDNQSQQHDSHGLVWVRRKRSRRLNPKTKKDHPAPIQWNNVPCLYLLKLADGVYVTSKSSLYPRTPLPAHNTEREEENRPRSPEQISKRNRVGTRVLKIRKRKITIKPIVTYVRRKNGKKAPTAMEIPGLKQNHPPILKQYVRKKGRKALNTPPAAFDRNTVKRYLNFNSEDKQVTKRIRREVELPTSTLGRSKTPTKARSTGNSKGESESSTPRNKVVAATAKAPSRRGRPKQKVSKGEGDGDIDPPKKPRAKVNLDPETNKLWKLMKSRENGNFDEGTDVDPLYWANQWDIFRGRADSFIARMHLLQGDRSFSKWDGSVLDSVIGVFLTQNVSDNLSSSAYMSLASHYPNKSILNHRRHDGAQYYVEEPEPCTVDSLDEVQCQPFERNPGDGRDSNTTDSFGETLDDVDSMFLVDGQNFKEAKAAESNIKDEVYSLERMCADENANSRNNDQFDWDSLLKDFIGSRRLGKTTTVTTTVSGGKSKKTTTVTTTAGKSSKIRVVKKKVEVDWDSLRKEAYSKYGKRKRTHETMDSMDLESIKNAEANDIAGTINGRGQHNRLAARIKKFLNRVVTHHQTLDLEWLRDVPPNKVTKYLLDVDGLGLKSAECIRLLTLQQHAFPVDTNVARIAVRLGWVPLQQLPESVQLHEVDLYPTPTSIQKYLWPRLSKLDQQTLYELHYQMITFGKVFCTKKNPNCNACPMRTECKYFASAFASARLPLPGAEKKSSSPADNHISAVRMNPMPRLPLPGAEKKCSSTADNHISAVSMNPMPPPRPEAKTLPEASCKSDNREPIIEAPASPDNEHREIPESDIEDFFYQEPDDEIPEIKLNMQDFASNLQSHIQENNLEFHEVVSNALVALTPEAASLPRPKLKNVRRLRTEHQVYELHDSHPLLNGMPRRVLGDIGRYLLAVWTPDETAESSQPPMKRYRGGDSSSNLCNEKPCFSGSSQHCETVKGTLLIPCKTAMEGRFPLNGTYFQVNEVFADHDSSIEPIDVPRAWLWNLPRRIVWFSTSIPSIFKGLDTSEIQSCFWRGYVCLRGFDRQTGAPRPLVGKLHKTASRLKKMKGN